MKDSRLVKLLKTFTEDELNSFVKFIESPFLKPNRDITGFFAYLKENLQDDKSDNLEKKLVFKNVFNQKYNEKKLVNHMFDLTKTAEDFLTYTTLKEDKLEFHINLGKGYLGKHLLKDSMRVMKALEKNLVPGFSVRKDYISKFRRMTQLKNAYYTEVQDFESLLDSKSDYFNASVIQFIMDYIELLGNKEPAINNFGKNIETPFTKALSECFNLDKFVEAIKNEKLQTPYIGIFYYMLRILKEPENTNHYYMFKSLFYNSLSKKKSPFDREEKFTIFNYLINYCTQRHSLEFMRESFDVSKKMLEHNAYSDSANEYMQTTIFRNIVKVCISLMETKWLEQFIKKYTDKLSPEQRKEMANLAYAHLFFSRKEFEKALEMISEMRLSFVLSKSDIKTFLLKIYYELEYEDAAYDLVAAYRQYLLRAKNVSKEYIKVFKNFIGYYFRLLKIKSGESEEEPGFVKSEIEKESKIINKQWLLEKANEVENKKR